MNLNELNELRLKVIEAKLKFDQAANEYAARNCGTSIGDIVEVTEISHKGKSMEVYKIGLQYDNWTGEYSAVLHGSVLKNDKSISRNSANTLVKLGKAGV